MANITLRSTKGAPLSNQEIDDNFTNLDAELDTKGGGDSAAVGTAKIGAKGLTWQGYVEGNQAVDFRPYPGLKDAVGLQYANQTNYNGVRQSNVLKLPDVKYAEYIASTNQIAFASDLGLTILNATTYQVDQSFLVNNTNIVCLATNSNSSLLAVGLNLSAQINIIVYNTSNWTVAQEITQDSSTDFLTFSPDGAWLVSNANIAPFIRIYDTTTWTIVAGSHSGLSSADGQMEFSPDGTLLAISSTTNNNSRIINTSTWATVTTFTAGHDYMSFRPDGLWVVAALSGINAVSIIEVGNWTNNNEIISGAASIFSICKFSSDSSKIYIGKSPYTLDATTYTPIVTDLPTGFAAKSITEMPNDTLIWSGINVNDAFITKDLQRTQAVSNVSPGSSNTVFAYSDILIFQNILIGWRGYAGTTQEYTNLNNLNRSNITVGSEGDTNFIYYHKESDNLYFAHASNRIQVKKWNNGAVGASSYIPTTDGKLFVNVSPNGRYLAHRRTSPRFYDYNITNHTLTNETQMGASLSATDIIFSPDSTRVVACLSSAARVLIYDTSSKADVTPVAANFSSLPGTVYGALYLNNGAQLALAHAGSPYVTIYNTSDWSIRTLNNPTAINGGTLCRSLKYHEKLNALIVSVGSDTKSGFRVLTLDDWTWQNSTSTDGIDGQNLEIYESSVIICQPSEVLYNLVVYDLTDNNRLNRLWLPDISGSNNLTTYYKT